MGFVREGQKCETKKKEKYLHCLRHTEQETDKTRAEGEQSLVLAQCSWENVGNAADNGFHHGELQNIQKGTIDNSSDNHIFLVA